MGIISYATYGFEGRLVSIEVDIRAGLPGTDIVGLPGDAVREAKQRVRVAIVNAGFTFPSRKVLVNLAPAGLKKAGASFDLPIALAILLSSNQMAPGNGPPVLAVGEVELSGRIRGVSGVLAAVALGLQNGVRHFLVPTANGEEAAALGEGVVWPVDSIADAVQKYRFTVEGRRPVLRPPRTIELESDLDYADMRGQVLLKRAMEVAAAGGHNILLFGSQGIGKSMAAHRLPSILPPLQQPDALVVTRLHSLAGLLPEHTGLMSNPVLRAPHHSASLEGMLGGGRTIVPGEVSLAHCGVLFLDEATEYRRDVLQALREPCETRAVTIVRAGQTHTFPAAFQLVAAANPCPCGNLGHSERRCLCGIREIEKYWKRFGGPLMDRIDMRVLVTPADPGEVLGDGYESSATMKARVAEAHRRQRARQVGSPFRRNADLGPRQVRSLCSLSGPAEKAFLAASRRLMLSTRASESVLKMSRTIADLGGSDSIEEQHVLEAAAYRRYGDTADLFDLGRQAVGS